MAIKDWTRDAAKEICVINQIPGESQLSVEEIILIIEKHCPFKKEVAYEEVGEQSKKLSELLALCYSIKRSM